MINWWLIELEDGDRNNKYIVSEYDYSVVLAHPHAYWGTLLHTASTWVSCTLDVWLDCIHLALYAVIQLYLSQRTCRIRIFSYSALTQSLVPVQWNQDGYHWLQGHPETPVIPGVWTQCGSWRPTENMELLLALWASSPQLRSSIGQLLKPALTLFRVDWVR